MLQRTKEFGLMEGYADAEELYVHLIGYQSPHHLAYGQMNGPGPTVR